MHTALYSQPEAPPERPGTPQLAVEYWLREAFHRTYDAPEQAPIPEELLALIQEAGRA